MATINIGNLTFTHKGDYASGTAYVKNDVVYYSTNGNAYIAKQATTGNAPTNATYWNQFAAGSGGIWNAGLSLGSAGQSVKVNAAGNALEFGDASSGKIGAIAYGTVRSTQSIQSTTYGSLGLEATITPTKAGSSILVIVSVSSGSQGGTSAGHHYALFRDVNATGTDTKITEASGTASGSRNTGMFSGSSESGSDWTQESSSANYLDTSARGLSYTLGQTVKYKVKAFSSGSVAVMNKSYRDGNNNDDTRTMSSITVMEILA
jgi:hypothetical protein